MDDTTRLTFLERQLTQAQKVLADLRHAIAALEIYAPRRHAVRVLRRRLMDRTRRAAA